MRTYTDLERMTLNNFHINTKNPTMRNTLYVALACRELQLTDGNGVPLNEREVTRILGQEDDRRHEIRQKLDEWYKNDWHCPHTQHGNGDDD